MKRYHCYGFALKRPRSIALAGVGDRPLQWIGVTNPTLGVFVAECDIDEKVDLRTMLNHHAIVGRLDAKTGIAPTQYDDHAWNRSSLLRVLRRDRESLIATVGTLVNRVEIGVRYQPFPIGGPPPGLRGRERLIAGQALLRASEARHADLKTAIGSAVESFQTLPTRWKTSVDRRTYAGAILVSRPQAEDLRAALGRHLAAFGEFEPRVTGPYPPYSFAPILSPARSNDGKP